MMKVATLSDVPPHAWGKDGRSTRHSYYLEQRLQQDDAAKDGLNFIFVRNDFFGMTGENAFATPRHRHTFAQVKFIEKGRSNYGPDQYIEEGDLAYFPRNAFYGPQVKENLVSIGTQFGFNGEHQKGEVWEGYRHEAIARLKERGRIEGGVYHIVDPVTGEETTREPVEAVYEEQYRMHTGGKELVSRPPGFDEVVLIHPKSFPYFAIGDGVELRELARFYDWPGPNGDVHIAMVRLSGGTYRLSENRAQVAWTLSPGLTIDDRTCTEFSSVYSPLGEETSLSADGGLEVYIIEYPRLEVDYVNPKLD